MGLPTGIIKQDWVRHSAPQSDNVSLPPKKDGQFYISSNGSIFRHYKHEDDRLILAPANVIVHEKNKSANDRNKREMLERLRLLIEMRDLVMNILHLQEKTPDDSVLSPWQDLQKTLKKKYGIFLETFGPIYKTESDHSYPNLRKFRKDPDGHRVASLIESCDDLKNHTGVGDIFNPRVLAHNSDGLALTSHHQSLIEIPQSRNFLKPCFVLSEENFFPFMRQFFKLHPLANLFVIDQDQWIDDGAKLSVDEKMERFVNKVNNNSWDGILIMPVHFKKLVKHKYFDLMNVDHYFIDESIQSHTIDAAAKIDESLISKFTVPESKKPPRAACYDPPSLAA